MSVAVFVLVGILIIGFSFLIFGIQKQSWRRNVKNASNVFSKITAGLSVIAFVAVMLSGIWAPAYVPVPAVLLIVLLVAPVLYNLYSTINKKQE
jgi:hypothetical protein